MRSRLLQISLCVSLLAGCGFLVRPLWAHWLLHSAATESNGLYATYRPFTYRWIGAPYAKRRGLGANGCIPVPESETDKLLLETTRAEKILGQTSSALQLLGRAGLLACQPEDSITKYKLALLLDPENSSLQLELGVAFALDANVDRALEHEAALEHTLRAGRLKRTREFLFDSALMFQETQLPIQANAQWVEAVAAESSTPWEEESSRRLMLSQNLLQTREHEISALSSPASFLAADKTQQKEGEELALGIATEQWLAEFDRSLEAPAAVRQLSRLLIRDHHDYWLEELLNTTPSLRIRTALRELSEAVMLNMKGEHRHAAESAHSAEEIFIASHNPAGALRSRLEIVYSLDRRAQAEDCLAALGNLQKQAHRRRYTWIEAQARLEHITCLTRTRQTDVIEARKQAYQWITSTGYKGLALRSLGFMTESYVAADARLTLWRRGQQGLGTFWNSPLPPLRGYSFYYTLADSAQKAGNTQAALAILREGTLLLKGSGLNLIRGILLSSLGQWEMEAGSKATGDDNFDEMAGEFKQVDFEEIKQVWAEAEVAHAEALIATGRARDGLALLGRWTEGSTWPYRQLNSNLRRVLLPALGNAYLRTGDLQNACSNFLQSITESRDKLASVHSRAQRDNALREMESSWRGLTEVKLRLHRPAEALTIWEAFRSERNSRWTAGSIPRCDSKSSPKALANPKGITFLVYAFLPGGFSGWILDERGLEQHWLDGPSAKAQAERLSALVADSNSSLADISALSAEVYKLVLKPFAGRLPESGTLVIDSEGELAAIPWNTLEASRNHPLIERFSISQSVGIANVSANSQGIRIGLDRPLIFGPPEFHGNIAYQYPPLDDAADEAETLHRLLPNSVVFKNNKASLEVLKAYAPDSTLFHFAGHAISNAGFGALLLAKSAPTRSPVQYLTSEQIADLDLRQMRTVVLSACSGAGEQTGIINLDGLTGAFLEAGVDRVIAAKWDVDSSSTAELMDAFYKDLLDGKPPAAALRLAQLRVREQRAHPYYWAGFQIFGAP